MQRIPGFAAIISCLRVPALTPLKFDKLLSFLAQQAERLEVPADTLQDIRLVILQLHRPLVPEDAVDRVRELAKLHANPRELPLAHELRRREHEQLLFPMI